MYCCTLDPVKRTVSAGFQYKVSNGTKFVPVGEGEDAKMLFFKKESPPQIKRRRVMACSIHVNEHGKKGLALDDPNDHRFCVMILGEKIEIISNGEKGFETVTSTPGATMIIVPQKCNIKINTQKETVELTAEILKQLLPA